MFTVSLPPDAHHHLSSDDNMSGTSPGGGAGALGGCGGAGAPTARCAKRWFPPATFQMRLRVLREVAFVRGLRREDLSGGTFHFTLHLSVESEPFYTSSEGK